ncbi:MAG: VWA-like domain-containing protein [Clostridia bacterium]|nr:VWA-like domain-containing protein [Clostridia bacterium]
MKIQEVIMHLLLKQPFYGYIAASVTPVESDEIPTVRMTMTPAVKLIYNRGWYESLPEEHAIGTIIHELLHLVLLHPYRKGSRERHLWVIACDLAVNEHIHPRMLPPEAITVDKISEEIKENLPRLKSAEAYYDILSNSENQVSFNENDKEIKVVLRSGQELKANNSTEGDSSEINKSAVKCVLSELIDQAEAEGEIPGEINGFINELYKVNEVNWRNVLKRFLSGKGKVVTRKTCKKVSKRFEDLPGNKRSVGVNALLAVDESGSISDKQVMKFYNELLSVKKITGANLSVTRFDTECTQPVALEKYIRDKQRVKNGGTDFRPVFELADRIKTHLLIIFTDGEGSAPEYSNQQVLWVLTKGGKKPAEYGHSVMFEE